MKSHHSRGTKHEFVVTFFILSFWSWFHYLTRLFFFNSESYHVGQSPYGFLFIYVVRTLSTGRAGWWNARLALLNYDVLHTTEAAWPENIFFTTVHNAWRNPMSAVSVFHYFLNIPLIFLLFVFLLFAKDQWHKGGQALKDERGTGLLLLWERFLSEFFPSTLAVLIICFPSRFLNVKFCFSINNVKKNASITYAEKTHELTLFHINCLFVPRPATFCLLCTSIGMCVCLLKSRLYRFFLSLFVPWERLVFLGLEITTATHLLCCLDAASSVSLQFQGVDSDLLSVSIVFRVSTAQYSGKIEAGSRQQTGSALSWDSFTLFPTLVALHLTHRRVFFFLCRTCAQLFE